MRISDWSSDVCSSDLLFGVLLQLRLLVLLPKEASVGQAGGEDFLIACHNRFAAVMRINIGSADEARREFALRVLHGKIFLIGPHGALNTLRRQLPKYRIEMANPRPGPFFKAHLL